MSKTKSIEQLFFSQIESEVFWLCIKYDLINIVETIDNCDSHAISITLNIDIDLAYSLLYGATALDILEIEGQYFKPSKVGKKYLCKSSKSYIRDFYYENISRIRDSENAKGIGAAFFDKSQELAWKQYADSRLAKFDLSTSTEIWNQISKKKSIDYIYKVADISGGCCELSLTLAKNIKGIKVYNFDKSCVHSSSIQLAKQLNISDCLEVVDWSLGTDISNFGVNFELIICSDILHYFDRNKLSNLLQDLKSVMSPGGNLLIKIDLVDLNKNDRFINYLYMYSVGAYVKNYSIEDFIQIMNENHYKYISCVSSNYYIFESI